MSWMDESRRESFERHARIEAECRPKLDDPSVLGNVEQEFRRLVL